VSAGKLGQGPTAVSRPRPKGHPRLPSCQERTKRQGPPSHAEHSPAAMPPAETAAGKAAHPHFTLTALKSAQPGSGSPSDGHNACPEGCLLSGSRRRFLTHLQPRQVRCAVSLVPITPRPTQQAESTAPSTPLWVVAAGKAKQPQQAGRSSS